MASVDRLICFLPNCTKTCLHATCLYLGFEALSLSHTHTHTRARNLLVTLCCKLDLDCDTGGVAPTQQCSTRRRNIACSAHRCVAIHRDCKHRVKFRLDSWNLSGIFRGFVESKFLSLQRSQTSTFESRTMAQKILHGLGGHFWAF